MTKNKGCDLTGSQVTTSVSSNFAQRTDPHALRMTQQTLIVFALLLTTLCALEIVELVKVDIIGADFLPTHRIQCSLHNLVLLTILQYCQLALF